MFTFNRNKAEDKYIEIKSVSEKPTAVGDKKEASGNSNLISQEFATASKVHN